MTKTCQDVAVTEQPAIPLPPQVQFARAIAQSGMSRTEVAERIGYASSQAAVVSMMASGSMRIPVDKAPAIAKALNLDLVPFVLFILTQAGHKGMVNAIALVSAQRPVSEREYSLIQAIRRESQGVDVDWSRQPGLMDALTPEIRAATAREHEQALGVLRRQHARDGRYVNLS